MITFRKATELDLPELDVLVNSAYRGDSSKKGWTTEADLLGGQRTDQGKLRELIENPAARIELAVEGGKIIGCVYLSQDGDSLYLGMLTVNPEIQSQGLGKQLLLRSEEIARELKLSQIRMTVISVRTELIEFYERRGYKWTGKTEPFPATDPRFGIPKQQLIFYEFVKKI